MPEPLYRRPFVNQSGETIPAFGVLEVGGWVDDSKGRSVFRAVKPTKDGKIYYVNGPLAVPSGSNGWAASADGHWALYEGTSTPQLNQEYGPKAGSWALHADGKGGFIIIADARGAAAPPPGFPTGASTKRIRVKEQAKAEVVNRVQGTVASTASETTPQFLINRIVVLSGVDPREDPNSEIESIVVQNNLRKSYTNGVDRVIATQSKSDQKWYVETATGGGANRFHGRLVEDLRITDATVRVQLERFTGSPPVDGSGIMTVKNVTTNIVVDPRPNAPQRYVHCGNAGGHCTGTELASGDWYLDTVEAPTKKPTRETA